MAAVHELVKALPALRQEVGLLLRGLAEVGAEEGLLELQEATQGLLEAGEAALVLVWSDTVVQGEGERFGPEATTEDIVRGGQAQAEERAAMPMRHPEERPHDQFDRPRFLEHPCKDEEGTDREDRRRSEAIPCLLGVDQAEDAQRDRRT